jgi:hypothetical protein
MCTGTDFNSRPLSIGNRLAIRSISGLTANQTYPETICHSNICQKGTGFRENWFCNASWLAKKNPNSVQTPPIPSHFVAC